MPRDARIIVADIMEIDGREHRDVPLASAQLADMEDVVALVAAPVGDETRSQWHWIRLYNGDLILGVYPRGTMYEIQEGKPEVEWARTDAFNGGKPWELMR